MDMKVDAKELVRRTEQALLAIDAFGKYAIKCNLPPAAVIRAYKNTIIGLIAPLASNARANEIRRRIGNGEDAETVMKELE